jgi:ATP-dependent exoDNAse (exonuclease V) alpha subunit
VPIDRPPLELNVGFRDALDLLEKGGSNLFITGKAGTGKSTLLQLYRNTTRKNVVVLAPTGVAALNVRGQTIHSFFGFPPNMFPRKEIMKRRDRRLYRKIDVLIIDEISMVRADLIDHMDYFLRLNREINEPFGGVQVVFFGDLFQLPPVVASDFERSFFEVQYPSPYFFSAQLFQEGFAMEMLELRKVYRQDNRHFLRLLDAVRQNHADQDDLEELNERFLPAFESQDFYITLTARNATADGINQKQLAKIDAFPKVYGAKLTGEFNPQIAPTDLALKLKEEAQVMLIKNDLDRRYVNGTIGKIVRLEEEKITIRIEDHQGNSQEIQIEPATWETVRYRYKSDNSEEIETEITGTFTQFPLKLAWAVTIHKAQGKTFDRVIIDLGGGAFEHGQTYVALSRCRTLDGIVLRQRIHLQDILTDQRIVDFYQAIK